MNIWKLTILEYGQYFAIHTLNIKKNSYFTHTQKNICIKDKESEYNYINYFTVSLKVET